MWLVPLALACLALNVFLKVGVQFFCEVFDICI
jgi:hypothetical protein